ncbi:hypothetical protein F5876DRAFT_65984 [Lentinula aff. lateritia]|uniref:Uncharacterized protein n=1 Tax=Lentinula aff. lateritia TaxID=2804960 RepID=A0ACC1TZK1_9AGAR|nr:hypothetical protein F5876DRAFT_65984 [Lentinula aff. lateritia]
MPGAASTYMCAAALAFAVHKPKSITIPDVTKAKVTLVQGVYSSSWFFLIDRASGHRASSKRSPKDLSKKVFLGYRAIDSTTAARYNREHRLVYKRTVSTQLGDGAYLTRRLGDWTESNVCAVYADAKRLASVKKKRESPVREEVIKTQLKMKERDIHKVILTSGIWGSNDRHSDVQMLIPPYFLADKDKDSSGKLGIYVICVPWAPEKRLPAVITIFSQLQTHASTFEMPPLLRNSSGSCPGLFQNWFPLWIQIYEYG